MNGEIDFFKQNEVSIPGQWKGQWAWRHLHGSFISFSGLWVACVTSALTPLIGIQSYSQFLFTRKLSKCLPVWPEKSEHGFWSAIRNLHNNIVSWIWILRSIRWYFFSHVTDFLKNKTYLSNSWSVTGYQIVALQISEPDFHSLFPSSLEKLLCSR